VPKRSWNPHTPWLPLNPRWLPLLQLRLMWSVPPQL
jgi:hypothetical protein